MIAQGIFLIAVSIFNVNPDQANVKHGQFINAEVTERNITFSSFETCEIYNDALIKSLESVVPSEVVYYEYSSECNRIDK